MSAADQIRVPTVPVEAVILLADGARQEVCVFLANASPFHEGPETLDEFLNSARPFLPARAADGRAHLIGTHGILTVSVDPKVPMLSRLPGRVVSTIDFVTLHLRDGSRLEGTLLANLPSDLARVSDAFNAEGAFIPIETGGRVSYVQKTYIAWIEF